jgi:hypothetical protein
VFEVGLTEGPDNKDNDCCEFLGNPELDEECATVVCGDGDLKGSVNKKAMSPVRHKRRTS